MMKTPFQKYLIEAISGPESGDRLYHKPPHGRIQPHGRHEIIVGPDVTDPELEVETGLTEDQYQSLYDLFLYLFNNTNLPWDYIFGLIGQGEDDQTTMQDIIDGLLNEDGTLNQNAIASMFNLILQFLHHWGDASFGGELSDFPFREQIFNGWTGWENGGGYFGSIWDALNQMLEDVQSGELYGDDPELAATILELLQWLIDQIMPPVPPPPPPSPINQINLPVPG